MSKKKKFNKELLGLMKKYRKLGPDYFQRVFLAEAILAADSNEPTEAVQLTLQALVDVSAGFGVGIALNMKPTVH